MLNEAQSVALELPFALEMLGIVIGTIGGTLVACERRLDLVGGVGLGMACGLGGGLIRDVIMQKGSVYMLDSPYGIPVAVVVSLLVFFFSSPFVRRPHIIEWLDILGVGVFAVAGCDKAMLYGLSVWAALLMGILTGNGGGLLRDIMLGDVPKLFRKGNWYGICALLGSMAYWGCVMLAGVPKGPAATLGVVVTIAARRASLRFNLQSPAGVDLTPSVKRALGRARRAIPGKPGRRG